MTPSDFRELVSGRRQGVVAAALRLALGLAEWPYAWAVTRRNRAFDAGSKAAFRPGVSVISVGNLTLGGTGKTPMVEWLGRWLMDHGRRVCLISRGYGARRGSDNDEAMELAQKLPGVPHVQTPDRSAAARRAIAEFGADVLLLDDAFQHRRIARDLDIVLLDALEPFGFDHVFPRGTLREPVEGLRRAQVVVLSRAELLAPHERDEVRLRALRLAPQAVWAEATHAPRTLLAADGRQQRLDAFRGQPIAGFCGLGNPAGFRHTLATGGFQVAGFREFPDHHQYTASDADSLAAWAESLGAAALICTHKDLVKLNRAQLGGRPLWAVAIGIDFLAGESDLERLLTTLLPKGLPQR